MLLFTALTYSHSPLHIIHQIITQSNQTYLKLFNIYINLKEYTTVQSNLAENTRKNIQT